GHLPYGIDRRRGSQHNHVDLQSHEVVRNFGKALVFSLRKAPLDDKILSFSVIEFSHPLRKSGEGTGYGRTRCSRKKPDAPDFTFPCVRQKRPSCRAAKKSNELPPPDTGSQDGAKSPLDALLPRGDHRPAF